MQKKRTRVPEGGNVNWYSPGGKHYGSFSNKIIKTRTNI